MAKKIFALFYGALNATLFAHLPMYMEIAYYVSSGDNGQTLTGRLISFMVHVFLFAINLIVLKKTQLDKTGWIGFGAGYIIAIALQLIIINPDAYWMTLVGSMNILSIAITVFIISREWTFKFKKAEEEAA